MVIVSIELIMSVVIILIIEGILIFIILMVWKTIITIIKAIHN